MDPLVSARQSWERVPLSRRMVVLMVLLLAAGLTIAGTLMVGVLQGHLVRQVDRQLADGAKQFVASLDDASLESHPTLLPSDYYVLAQIYEGKRVEFLTQATEQRAGVPELSDLIYAADATPLTAPSNPITVASTVHGSTWRAMMLPMHMEGKTSPVGVVVIALPLLGVTETLTNTALSFLLIGSILVLLSAIAGSYLVQRSLAPLRNIEHVAGAIAAGDLSKRIPDSPDTTEVGSLSSSLNKMLVQIERSFDAQYASEQRMRRFVSDASHELRTPLAAIRGYAELYRIGAVGEDDVADVMGRIESESTRMGTLVEDLLTLARLDEGPNITVSSFDLVELANETRSDMLAIDPTRSVVIEGIGGQDAPESLMVDADRNQMVQVFLNLAGNITRYTPKGSPVEIRLGIVGDFAEVEFRDHGPGVEMKDRPRVFERFFRTGISRSRDQGGSGLGLSIVRSIIVSHGGDVSLWETDPHGLTVKVTFRTRQDTIDEG